MEKVILIGLIVMLFVALIYVLQTRSINKKSEDSKPKETPFTRADKQWAIYQVTHKAGTKVVAESKDGTWKEGMIIGKLDWQLFTFFFTIKFNDGEIIKQEEGKVTKI